MTDWQLKFLILVFLVVLITVGFAILIWQQTKKVEKKALLAKQKQKNHEQKIKKKLWSELQALKEAEKAMPELEQLEQEMAVEPNIENEE
ncbi:MAG TPA: hypothetical protein GX404_04960 [Syntrophomonadaceae bacterium]|jgi:sensor domain CHASE-containing protein|nr:hypothetical protein [Syntrophomonadaceae bacterium]